MSEETRKIMFSSNVTDFVDIPGPLDKEFVMRVTAGREGKYSLHVGYQFPLSAGDGTPSYTGQFAVAGLIGSELETSRDALQEALGGYSYAELQRENENLGNRVTELQSRLEEAEGKELIAEETRDAQQSREAETVAAEERP